MNKIEDINKLHSVLLEMLYIIDDFCKKWNIKYTVYAGTALGAVREKNIIPWDDDVDICMDINEYNRFVSIWNLNKPQGYILQDHNNTILYKKPFGKIRKLNTTFLENTNEIGMFHTGIYIDIFVSFHLPKKYFEKKTFIFYSYLYLIFLKEIGRNSLARIINKLKKLIPLKTREFIVKKSYAKLSELSMHESIGDIVLDEFKGIKRVYPYQFSSIVHNIKIGEKIFLITDYYDDYLKLYYGDYMILPPVSERTWKHKPIILDFYKEI